MTCLLNAQLIDASLEVFDAIKLAQNGNDQIWDRLMEKLKDVQIGRRKDERVVFSQSKFCRMNSSLIKKRG